MKTIFFTSVISLIFVSTIFSNKSYESKFPPQTVENCPQAGPDREICYGECVYIGCDLDSNTEGYCYTWILPTDIVGEYEFYAGNMIEVCPEFTTTYTLFVTDDDGNLINEDQVTITIVPPPNVQVNPPGGIICEGQNITLSASPGFSSYSWSTGETTSSIIISNSGIYSVTVANETNCSTSVDIKIANADASFDEISNTLKNLGFLKIPVEIVDPTMGITENFGTNECSTEHPNVVNTAGNIVIAENMTTYCLNDAVIGDIITSISEGDNVGGIIVDDFCTSGYDFSQFFSFGENNYEAVMQVYVFNSSLEDYIFINTRNYQLTPPEILPDIIYPPTINILENFNDGCNYQVRILNEKYWGFKQNSAGNWSQDTPLEVVKRTDFGEDFDLGDLDNTCCDGESIDIDSYPWYSSIKTEATTGDLRFKFNLGLVNSVTFLGCWGCTGYAQTIRDDFYEGETRTLEWPSASPFSSYVRKINETNETISDIEDKIQIWYWANDGLSGIFDDSEVFFSGIHQPDYGSWLNFGAAATIGGTQNMRVKITGVKENCSTSEVICVFELGIADTFGAGQSDGKRWKFPGLISQFHLQHFRNEDCDDVSSTEQCYTPLIHWVNIKHRFTFQN